MKFKDVEPLYIGNDDGRFMAHIIDEQNEFISIKQGQDSVALRFDEALTLRDWLNRVLDSYPAWQPIETAPKDREIILAGPWLSGEWQVTTGQWLINRFPYVGEGQPSHWMPLPAAPAQDEQGEGSK